MNNILQECDGLSREEQTRVLLRLAPNVQTWTDGASKPACSAFLIVATWSIQDRVALEDFLLLQECRILALQEWFSSREELQSASGYDGPCLQSPVLVIRDAHGSVAWRGEGFAAREELKRRAKRGS